MIGREQVAEIRRLFFAEHWKVGTIVAQLGVHCDVVTRAIGPTGRAARDGTRPSVVDPYKSWIEETLLTYPRLVATRVYDMVCERGYTGSLRTLRRYIGKVRPVPKSEVFLRTTTLPGEQAQVDWGHVGTIAVPGGVRALWVFVMVLMYSRAIFAELVLDLRIDSVRRSLIRAARFFGGVPRQWLFDNPKTIVLERQGTLVRYHPALLELSSQLCVEPRLCGVRKPQQKGGVERAIRYLKERFFAARTIRSVERGNAELLEFIDEIASQRSHPMERERTVAEMFEREKPHLLVLREPLPEIARVEPVTVDKTATIQFDTNRYSVPPEHACTTRTLVASDIGVKVLHEEKVIASHPRCWGKHQRLDCPAHRQVLLEQKRGARKAVTQDLLQEKVPRIDELFVRWLDDGRNLGSLVARTKKLLEDYGAEILTKAVQALLEKKSHDFGALAILCEELRRPKSQRLPLLISPHVPDREVVPHDLGSYDHD